ncbi:MAG: pitrilysin family protein [Gemmatimonadales bacterium]|nr:pitrilysin family protein [Gemmatimonadales bacterium]
MMRNRLSGLVLMVGLAGVLPAQAPTPPVRGATVEGITEYTLGNGLKVLLFPDASKPTTTVNITYFVGSRHEGYGETGMAHLLEHLVFKGTPTHPNIMQELTERGASPNGTTWYDRTNYFETFPASDENLAWAIGLEADRMVNSFIAKKDLDSEMTVVRNEFESGENSPSGVLMERVLSTAFLWHNYGKSTIGARADLENVPIERLQAFYRKYYQPDNAMLVVAGKFEPARALELVQQHFGAVPRPVREGGMTLWPTYTLDPVQDGERTVTLRRVGDTPSLTMSWHIPHGAHPDHAALAVFADVLTTPSSGRLYKAAVEPKLASNVAAFPFQLREPGVMLVMSEIPKEGDPAAARDAILSALQAVASDQPPTDEEVERGKAALLRGIELQMTNSASIGLSLSEWASMGDWRLMYLHRDRIRSVTTDDVTRVAATYFKPDNRTVGTFIPTPAPDRVTLPPAPDVLAMVKDYRGDTAMVAGEAFEPTPEVLDARTVRRSISPGLELAVLPKTTRGEVVTARITLRMGNERELMNLGAVPGLTGGMLMRGTTRRTRQEIQDELNRLKAQVFVGGGATSATASITVKKAQLAEAMALAFELLREPRFDAAEFDLLRTEQVTALEGQRSEPQMQAVMAIQRHLSPFPKGHPNYVGTLDETLADLNAARLDDLRRFHARFYGAARGEVGIVGDVDPDEMARLVESGLGGWTSPVAYQRIAEPTRTSQPLNISLETPDKANAMFLAGRVMPLNDRAADYPAMVLADFILGGGFLNSRLATRIRQQEGLSYGVGSSFQASALDSMATWTSYAIYAPENRDKLEAALKEELLRAAKDGFTADEVAKAKQGWIESRKQGRANDAAVASRLGSNIFLGRTFARDTELESAVAALTPAQLQAVVARYLDPEGLAIVKAGDFRPKSAAPATP